MIEILHFVFRDGWTWAGCTVMLWIVAVGVAHFKPFRGMVEIRRQRATSINERGKADK